MDTFEELLRECDSAIERYVRFKIGNVADGEDILN